MKIVERILHIWDCSGSTFLFKYLKEVLRLTVRNLSGIDLYPSKKIFVKLGYKCYPYIIPKEIIDSWYGVNNSGSEVLILNRVIGTLTLLSIFRVLPTRVKPDYSTVVEPFKGTTPTISLDLIREALVRLKLDKGKKNFEYKFVSSLKAGPNGYVSILSTALDAIAFLGWPNKLWDILYFNIKFFKFKGLVYTLWLVIVIITALPYFILCRLVGSGFPIMGRLSVVYDQAGKARIVGITNSWIQSSLYPLHQYLFEKLKRIPMDGTMDQERPFNLLIKKLVGRLSHNLDASYWRKYRFEHVRVPLRFQTNKQTLYGYDLSAATDRLPIVLQKDILNCMGLSGDAWANLLNIEYLTENGFIKYSCGQPMGAYSSFAMLAITHHVIVQIAAIKAGISDVFTDYCILGDDIVIADDKVAHEYLELMKILGLDISEGKSIVSNSFTEFAKRLRGCIFDITPIGPGLILQSLRNRYYICVLIYELLRRELIHVDEVFPQLVSLLPRKYRRYSDLINWFVVLHLRTAQLFDHRDQWWIIALETALTLPKERFDLLIDMLYASICSDGRKLWASVKEFLNKGIFYSQSRVGLPDWIEFMNLFIVPSTYTLIRQYLISLNDLSRKFGLYLMIKEELKLREHRIEDVQYILSLLERVSIIDLNMEDKARVKVTLDTLYKLNKIFIDKIERFRLWKTRSS